MERPPPPPPPAAEQATINNNTTATPAPRPVLLHFVVGQRQEIALFRTDTPDDQLKDLFRSAAEAGPRDILKLYSSSGLLMNISPELPSNSVQNPYNLQVVAAHANGMLLEEVGLDLRALEDRITELEKQLRLDYDVLPPAVQDLKHQVDSFRSKLETTENLSWLGFYKQLPEPLSTDECRRLQYRRKSDSVKKRVKENFLNICDSAVTEPVRQWLRMPTFDSRQWEDEELLLLLQDMFLDLDLCSKFAIDISTLRAFLYEVYKNYNEVPFHNFRHCFCVAQMMYAIACYVDLPAKIGDLETLILITSSICHDLDHPGYNNIYQINAKTELALRYNDISPLENHHCSVAFRILENDDCNIFKSFNSGQFKQVREGMIRCILATDMARHNEILAQFKDITPVFDYTNKTHTNLLCMVLIKVADISNEARPMEVAEPWLDRLLQEFFKQSDAEKLEGLPVTPFMDRDKITKPSSQCSFIGFVLLPLFEALGELFTELQELIVQPVREALDYYRRLNEATKEERMHRKSIVAEMLDHGSLPLSNNHSPDNSTGPVTGGGVPKSGSNHSVRSRKINNFQQNRSRSRSTDEDNEHTENTISDEEPCSLADVAEDTESGDSETATEVEVSEKTLKFKISTEGAVASGGRKSYPGSRKGSRERVQQLNCLEVARAVQGEKERRKLISGGLSFDQRTLMGKKLSFDTSELMDEHARRYFRQFSRRVSNDLASPEDAAERRNAFGASLNVEEKKSILKHADSRPCETYDNKQNNISAEQAMEVRENSLRPDENGDKADGEQCKTDSCPSEDPKQCQPVINSCKFDKISVDKTNKLVRGDSADEKRGDEKHPSPNGGNRSLLSRLKHFTDRLGLSIDRDAGSKFKGMKFNALSLKNNNGTRMTLPARNRNTKKDGAQSPCCKGVDMEEDKRASTLPKANKPLFAGSGGLGAGKKSWRQRILGKERTTNSLDVLPPGSPVTPKPSTSQSENNSRSGSPRRDATGDSSLEAVKLGPLEPDPEVLGTTIELM